MAHYNIFICIHNGIFISIRYSGWWEVVVIVIFVIVVGMEKDSRAWAPRR